MPLLVLVSGAPASGKSTLASRLARSLALPLMPREVIREAISDALDIRSGEQRRATLDATFRVFYRLMGEILGAGSSVVAESNFHRGAAEQDLRPLLAKARAVIIHCQAAREVSYRRFAGRREQGERHWSSFDDERIAQIEAGQVPEAWERAAPLDLGVPILLVDTTDGYVPDLEAVLDFIRSHQARRDNDRPGRYRRSRASSSPVP